MKVQITLLASVILQSCFGMSLTAYRQGAEAKIVYRVVDDEGYPVSNARVQVWFRSDYPKLDIRDWVMSTDTNGEFVAKCQTNERVSIGVDKEGYYHTFDRVTFRSNANEYKIVNGKWQPYGETRTVVLKKIRNPVEMVEAPYRVSKAISYGKWYGYDMVRADWMPPNGEGESMDVLVRLGLKAVNDTSDFRTTMELCFTNNPHAGVYKISKDNWSEMKSIYRADTNAVYKSDISFVFERHPRMPIVDTRLSENSCLVFRIRTKVDACGKLISAHYGKIYGLWPFFGAMTSPELFFNPTPNDTNLEDAETARKSRLAYKQQIEFERRRKAQGK